MWKIVGRADEQIILSNGEKTNPVPLGQSDLLYDLALCAALNQVNMWYTEKMINEDPFVRGAVMFGRGKFQNGVLIEPTEDFQIDPTDVKQLEANRNKIWYVNNMHM